MASRFVSCGGTQSNQIQSVCVTLAQCELSDIAKLTCTVSQSPGFTGKLDGGGGAPLILSAPLFSLSLLTSCSRKKRRGLGSSLPRLGATPKWWTYAASELLPTSSSSPCLCLRGLVLVLPPTNKVGATNFDGAILN